MGSDQAPPTSLLDGTKSWERHTCLVVVVLCKRKDGLVDHRCASHDGDVREEGPCGHVDREERAQAPRRARGSGRGGACRRPGVAQGARRNTIGGREDGSRGVTDGDTWNDAAVEFGTKRDRTRDDERRSAVQAMGMATWRSERPALRNRP